MKYLIILFITAAFLLMSCCFFCEDDEIVIMTWNVQNLFDDVRQGSEYLEFDPENGQWNSNLYHLKLCAVADVITDPAAGDPDIVLLQEIENIAVLKTLADVYLKGEGYSFLHISGEEYSPVHTAIMSRYPISDIRSHRIWGRELADQRFIMEYEIRAEDKTLIVFNNHWKSKAGGDSDIERESAAEVLFSRVREIQNGSCHIIAAGDFNSEYSGGSPFFFSPECPELCPLVFSPPDNAEGTYAYKGEWEMIDMFFLAEKHQFAFDLYIADIPYITDDNGFPVRFSHISGKGYSDHLPLVMEIHK